MNFTEKFDKVDFPSIAAVFGDLSFEHHGVGDWIVHHYTGRLLVRLQPSEFFPGKFAIVISMSLGQVDDLRFGQVSRVLRDMESIGMLIVGLKVWASVNGVVVA